MRNCLFKRSSIAGLDNIKEIYLVKNEAGDIVCAVDSIDKYDELMETVSWWRDSEEVITDKTMLITEDDLDQDYYGNEYSIGIDENNHIVNVEYEKTRGFEKCKGVNVGNVYRIVSVFDAIVPIDGIVTHINVIIPEFNDPSPESQVMAIDVVKDYLSMYPDRLGRRLDKNIAEFNKDLLNDIIDE